MDRILRIACIIVLAAVMTGCASGPKVESGSIGVEGKDVKAVLVFSDSDRGKILHYYEKGKKSKELPPGLAKKQELPPGLQQHIEKYGTLPPGLEGRRLPGDLERTLSTLPEGYVRLKVGGDVVLMDEKTRVVFDVIWKVD